MSSSLRFRVLGARHAVREKKRQSCFHTSILGIERRKPVSHAQFCSRDRNERRTRSKLVLLLSLFQEVLPLWLHPFQHLAVLWGRSLDSPRLLVDARLGRPVIRYAVAGITKGEGGAYYVRSLYGESTARLQFCVLIWGRYLSCLRGYRAWSIYSIIALSQFRQRHGLRESWCLPTESRP